MVSECNFTYQLLVVKHLPLVKCYGVCEQRNWFKTAEV